MFPLTCHAVGVSCRDFKMTNEFEVDLPSALFLSAPRTCFSMGGNKKCDGMLMTITSSELPFIHGQGMMKLI